MGQYLCIKHQNSEKDLFVFSRNHPVYEYITPEVPIPYGDYEAATLSAIEDAFKEVSKLAYKSRELLAYNTNNTVLDYHEFRAELDEFGHIHETLGLLKMLRDLISDNHKLVWGIL